MQRRTVEKLLEIHFSDRRTAALARAEQFRTSARIAEPKGVLAQIHSPAELLQETDIQDLIRIGLCAVVRNAEPDRAMRRKYPFVLKLV